MPAARARPTFAKSVSMSTEDRCFSRARSATARLSSAQASRTTAQTTSSPSRATSRAAASIESRQRPSRAASLRAGTRRRPRRSPSERFDQELGLFMPGDAPEAGTGAKTLMHDGRIEAVEAHDRPAPVDEHEVAFRLERRGRPGDEGLELLGPQEIRDLRDRRSGRTSRPATREARRARRRPRGRTDSGAAVREPARFSKRPRRETSQQRSARRSLSEPIEQPGSNPRVYRRRGSVASVISLFLSSYQLVSKAHGSECD